MKKNLSFAKCMKQAAFGAFLLTTIAGQAKANFALNMQNAQFADQYSGPTALPNIVNSRPESDSRRALPAAQEKKQSSQEQFRQAYPERVAKPGPGAAEEENNVFADFVATVTGTQLELFGAKLFREAPDRFAPLEAAQVNGDYVIGTGDELQIRGWGMINMDVTATVDRSGAIYLPRVGAVNVAGVKYRDLQGHLKQAVSRIFTNFELTASISQTRAVQIYVVGNAVRPGTYTVSSMSTLLNALFTSGGPTAAGTMRNIQLKRGKEVVSTFDLYDMFVKGDKTGDVSLRDGDVIHIPAVGPLVALTGNVKTPAIFELKGPSNLAELIEWAGGVDSPADQKKIVIEKTVNNIYRTVAELVADGATMQRQLSAIPVLPTDVIRVFAPGAVAVQAQLQHEYVRVAGEVVNSGVYQIRKGETLRELIARVGGPTERGYLFATELNRETVRRDQQKRLDEVADRFERQIESSGAERLSDATDQSVIAVRMAEAERQRRFAQKLRTLKAEGRISLELERSDAQVRDLPDVALQDGDSIIVPRKPDTVQVLGSVFQSSSFIYKPRRTVRDYVELAGGVTEFAEPSEIYVLRADGTAKSGGKNWFGGVESLNVFPGDTIVVPEMIERTSWRQSLKEWTAIFYQFGLGAAGLKVLKD